MLLISTILIDDVLRFKAPKSMMYKIESISFANNSSVSAIVSVVDYLIEDEITDFVSTPWFKSLASFDVTIAGTNNQVVDINHKTKFLSIVKNSGNAVATVVNIYGELVKASKTELLIEWFRKGR